MWTRMALNSIPLSSMFWDYRHAPPDLVYTEPGTKLRTMCVLGKLSTHRATSSDQKPVCSKEVAELNLELNAMH